jgi:hypothetical protein
MKMEEIEWKFVAIVFGIALVSAFLYDRVLKDYIPGSTTTTTKTTV